MAEQETKKQNQFAVMLQQNLTSTLIQKAASLPKNFNQTKFVQNCLTALEEIEDIEQVEVSTIVKGLMKGAILGLDFLNKECYLIAYKNKETGKLELNFQTHYKGEKKLAMLYSVKPIEEITTELVREGDFYEKSVVNNKKIVNFKSVPFSDNPIIGAFTVILYKDGSSYSDDMSKKDIENVRQSYSKAKNSPAWTNSVGEMYRKTVLRRTLKAVERVFESPEQLRAYDDCSDFEFNNKPALNGPTTALNVFAPVEQQAQLPGSVEQPEEEKVIDIQPEEKFVCEDCGAEINEAENGYSRKHFKRPLCRVCQKAAKEGDK